LLVAPADPSLLIDIPDFIVDLASVSESVRALAATTLVGSDEDPWQPDGIVETFGSVLGLQTVVIPGARHFSLSDGFGNWAGVINWVNDPASDLSVR
jgi:predicted alpha/beta hydrolase family esterase